MPITPLNPALGAPLAGLSAGPDKGSASLQRTPNAPFAANPDPAPTAESATGTTDSVSLSAEVTSAQERDVSVPIYAEIWKGPVKLAQVDIHGHVTAFTGQVAEGGGGLAGPLLAAQRAVQVAQQTGGEIRAAGQLVDGQTLLMRARLASTYRT